MGCDSELNRSDFERECPPLEILHLTPSSPPPVPFEVDGANWITHIRGVLADANIKIGIDYLELRADGTYTATITGNVGA